MYTSDFEGEGVLAALHTMRQACLGCPMVQPCREWGIRHEPTGMWGGMTPNERRRERHVRRIVFIDLEGKRAS